MRATHLVSGVICAAALSACGSSSSGSVPAPEASQSPQGQAGQLTSADRALATRIARDQQRKVTGTFIGATGFTSTGTPFDPDGRCDNGRPYLNVRLVWKADASFTHGGVPGGPPAGPRKALVITASPGTGTVCETGAMYRNVGARTGETLLYGTWPKKADG